MNFKIIAPLAVAALIGAYAIVEAQTKSMRVVEGLGTTGQVLAFDSANTVRGSSALSAATSLTVGGGTAITKIQALTATFTPTVISAQACEERTVTVTGVTTADKIVVNGPAPSGPGPVSARQSGADTVAVMFCNPQIAATTPKSGTYSFIAIRS